mgnify:CR=1 FL=1
MRRDRQAEREAEAGRGPRGGVPREAANGGGAGDDAQAGGEGELRDVRGVPCVRRRARDRSIGRDRSEDPEIGLRLRRSGPIFLLLFFCARVSRLEDMAMYFLHVLCTRLMEY